MSFFVQLLVTCLTKQYQSYCILYTVYCFISKIRRWCKTKWPAIPACGETKACFHIIILFACLWSHRSCFCVSRKGAILTQEAPSVARRVPQWSICYVLWHWGILGSSGSETVTHLVSKVWKSTFSALWKISRTAPRWETLLWNGWFPRRAPIFNFQ